MRILFLSRAGGLQIGGIAEVVLHLSNYLSELGAQVFVYNNGKLNTEQPLDLIHNGTPCYSGPIIKPGISGWFSKNKTMRPLIELVYKNKIDIIQTLSLYRAGHAAMMLKKITGIPFVITSHGDILPTSSDRISRKAIIKRCKTILKSADAITHLTDKMANISHQILDTTPKSHIIPNGIDLAHWQSIKTDQPLDYIFLIGRLVKEKGFDVIIDALSILIRNGNPTSLVIAGEGPFEQDLVQCAKNHHLNVVYHSADDLNTLPTQSICFIGPIKGHVKRQAFCRSRAVLFPTQPHLCEEAFGLVPFEAIAAKRPLIISNLNRAYQLQQSGFDIDIVEQPDKPENWVTKIQDRLQFNIDQRIQIDNNFRLLNNFDWSYIAKQYYDLYKKIIK